MEEIYQRIYNNIIAVKKDTKSKEVAVIEKELNPMLDRAKKLAIADGDDMRRATEVLSQLNLAKDKVTERMETITKPAKEVIKGAEAVWKPFITAAKEAIEVIRDKMSDYQTAEVERAREEEAKIAARIGEGKGKLKIETAAKKFDDIEKPADKVVATSGSLKFQEMQQFEVMDVTMLPVDYILPNDVKIRAAMKAGTELPGVRYFTKQVPINNR